MVRSMSELRLEELSANNVVAANALTLKPGQDAFVTPVSESIAEAYVNQDTMWPRVVVLEDTVVGFIMGNFDADAKNPLYNATILRMNVDADHQRQGIGAFAVESVATEARARGFERVTAIWEEGDLGPGEFFRAVGFELVGETQYGEVIGSRTLA